MNERRGPRVQSSGRANATIVQSASSVSAPVVASGVTSAEVEPPLLEKCELVWPKRLPKVTVVETTKERCKLAQIAINERAEWRSRLKWDDECETAFVEDFSCQLSLESFTSHSYVFLDKFKDSGDERMIEVGCTLGGYTSFYRLYCQVNNNTVPVALPDLRLREDWRKGKRGSFWTPQLAGHLAKSRRGGLISTIGFAPNAACGQSIEFGLEQCKVQLLSANASMDCDDYEKTEEFWPSVSLTVLQS